MPEITAHIREKLGKQVNAIRKQGILPAVLYGEGVTSTPLTVSLREFEKILGGSGETSLLALHVSAESAKDGSGMKDGKTYNVLIHDVSRDPLTLSPIHADFYAVRMDKPIEARVPLNFFGESPAVKNDGGTLVKVFHELEIRALPKDLPHEIVVNIEGLVSFEDKIHVKDLRLPEGVSTIVHADEVVALVEPPRSDEELEALRQTPVETTAEVKTEREEKEEAKAKEEEAETPDEPQP